MKKLISLALVLIMTASMLVVGVSAAAGDKDTWDGTADTSWYDPTKTSFEISTAEQLAGVAELAKETNFDGVTLKLTADLVLNEGDASAWGTTAPANAWTSIGTKDAPFAGKFDGQGHTISGIYLYGPGDKNFTHVGLFGWVSNDVDYAEIKNLNITNSYMNVYARAGLLIGRVGENAIIENVRVSGTVIAIEDSPSTSGTYKANSSTGGVIGIADNCFDVIVKGCSFSGYVEGFVRTGGVIGSSTGMMLTVENCWSDAQVVSPNRVGGIVGHSGASLVEIKTCAFTGHVDHDGRFNKNYGAMMGGFRASATSELIITDCFYDAKFTYKSEPMDARVAATEVGVMTDDSTWYAVQDDKSADPTGNDADGCEASVTVTGDGAKAAFIAKLDSAIWDTATLKLKALTVNETATTPVAPVETTAAPVETTAAPVETTAAPVETTAAPVETTAAPVETTAAPVETTAAPVETTAAPVETTAAPAVEDTTAAPAVEDTTTAPEAKGGCGAVIGGGIVVATAILGCAWVSKRK